MDLTDKDIRVLRLFVSQGHNDVVWAQTNRELLTVPSNYILTLTTIDEEFEANLLWLSHGLKPWAV